MFSSNVDGRPAAREVDGIPDERSDVTARPDRLPSLVEREELTGQVPCREGAGLGLRDVLLDGVGIVAVGPGERQASQDARKQVVEVVGDAPCEQADRLKLLGAAALFQFSFLVGDVESREEDFGHHSFLVGERRDAEHQRSRI